MNLIKKFIAITLFIVITSNCHSQEDIIIDPVLPSPYTIEYKSSIKLPDSLGGKNYKGTAAVEGEIRNL